MIPRPPRSTRTDTLFPYTTLFRSALVLAIAVDALGADKVRAVMMPSPYTADISWIDEAGHELASHRSEEHTSELQSLMRISYAVFCLKKKKTKGKINSE